MPQDRTIENLEVGASGSAGRTGEPGPSFAERVLTGSGWLFVLGAVALEIWALTIVGLPQSVAGVFVLAVPVLPFALGRFQIETAEALADNRRHLRAFVLLVLLFACSWVTAWESQWFEPSGSYHYQGPNGYFLLGAQRPATWNLGRFVASAIAVVCGIAAISLLRPRRLRDVSQRNVLRVAAVATVVAVVASIPILMAREETRRERAREACTTIQVAKGTSHADAVFACKDA